MNQEVSEIHSVALSGFLLDGPLDNLRRVIMKIEQSLNLVPVKKPTERNPVVYRRERLTKAINQQIELVRKHRLGEKTTRLWFWVDEEGNYFLPIKYGKQVLELSKGKFAIQCSSLDDVETNLESVKSLVTRGSFDQILTNASQEIRKKFGKIQSK